MFLIVGKSQQEEVALQGSGLRLGLGLGLRYLGLTINSESLCSQRFSFKIIRTCEGFNNALNALCGTAKLDETYLLFLKQT